jgi:hypothetical protein
MIFTCLMELGGACGAAVALLAEQNSGAWEGLTITEKLFGTRYF